MVYFVTAKLVYAERSLEFQMHYTLTGRRETDRSAAAFWFARQPPRRRMLTVGSGEHGGTGQVRIVENEEQLELQAGSGFTRTPNIPSHAGDFKVTGMPRAPGLSRSGIARRGVRSRSGPA